jgi:hypothetical protein
VRQQEEGVVRGRQRKGRGEKMEEGKRRNEGYCRQHDMLLACGAGGEEKKGCTAGAGDGGGR